MFPSRCLSSLIRRPSHAKFPLVQIRQTGSDSSDDSPEAKARRKLDSLLQSIIKDESVVRVESKGEAQKSQPEPFKALKKRREEKKSDLSYKLVDAAKKVATNVEGDPSLTEAELLHKLLFKNKDLQKNVLKVSKNATLNDLLTTMNVEEEKKKEKPKLKQQAREYTRADQVRNTLSGKRPRFRPPPKTERFDIFSGQPLDVFKEMKPAEPELKVWNVLHSRELRLSVTHPPSNIWEQMIIWTDRGMLWKFPIDNEQGLDAEKEISFADHVFLETHLEGWCPTKGPIRHYMELVCVGLSRNHWLSSQEKKDHLLWYKEYFSSKKQLLAEIGAGDIQ